MEPKNNLLPAFVIAVEGMMCQKNCGSTVHSAIKSVASVEDALVSSADKRAAVWGKGVDLGEVISAVEDVGFD